MNIVRNEVIGFAVIGSCHPGPLLRVQRVIPYLTQRIAHGAIRCAACHKVVEVFQVLDRIAEQSGYIDNQVIIDLIIMTAVDIDTYVTGVRTAGANNIVVDLRAAVAVIHIESKVGVTNESIRSAEIIDVVIPDYQTLTSCITAAVNDCHVLAVDVTIVEYVVFDGTVKRCCRTTCNGKVHSRFGEIINLVIVKQGIHTAQLNTGITVCTVLIHIVDTVVGNVVVAGSHRFPVTAIDP